MYLEHRKYSQNSTLRKQLNKHWPEDLNTPLPKNSTWLIDFCNDAKAS